MTDGQDSGRGLFMASWLITSGFLTWSQRLETEVHLQQLRVITWFDVFQLVIQKTNESDDLKIIHLD